MQIAARMRLPRRQHFSEGYKFMRLRSEEAFAAIVGKIVSGVVVADNEHGTPQSQIFFTFRDGTAFELWGDEAAIGTGSGLDRQSVDEIARNLKKREGTTIRTFRPSYEDPEAVQQDLFAG